MCLKSEKAVFKGLKICVLILSVFLCFDGIATAQEKTFEKQKLQAFKVDVEAIRSKKDQISSNTSNSVNIVVNSYSTNDSFYESGAGPMNLFVEGEDIYLVCDALCGNTGSGVLYFFLTLPAGGTVLKTLTMNINIEDPGFNRFASVLTGGLPAGTYRLHVVALTPGVWIVSEGYTFMVL